MCNRGTRLNQLCGTESEPQYPEESDVLRRAQEQTQREREWKLTWNDGGQNAARFQQAITDVIEEFRPHLTRDLPREAVYDGIRRDMILPPYHTLEQSVQKSKWFLSTALQALRRQPAIYRLSAEEVAETVFKRLFQAPP